MVEVRGEPCQLSLRVVVKRQITEAVSINILHTTRGRHGISLLSYSYPEADCMQIAMHGYESTLSSFLFGTQRRLAGLLPGGGYGVLPQAVTL